MRLKYKDIVIGSTLQAALFAIHRNAPILFTEVREPFRFDYFSPTISFPYLGIPSENKPLKGIDDVLYVGPKKSILWERLLFISSLAGNLPLGGLCDNIRYDGKTLTCSNEYSKIAEIEFEHCYYFGDSGARGLLREKDVAKKEYICYDWIAFNRGGKHEIDILNTEDRFVKRIWFYPSDRIDGETLVKDACVVSHLNEAEIFDFDYSETMARFKAVSEMEKRGLKGRFNGYCPKYGNPKYYKFRTAHIHREKKLIKESEWVEEGNITSPTLSIEELLQPLPQIIEKRYQKLAKLFI